MNARRMTLLLTAALVMAATPALARGGHGHGHGHGGGEGGEPPTAEQMEEMKARFDARRAKFLRGKVGLTEDRAQAVEAVFERFKPDHQELRATAKAARKALRELRKSESEDDAAYAAAVGTLVDTRRAIDALRYAEFSELRTLLTGREQAKLLHGLKRMKHKMRGMHGKRGGKRGKRGTRGKRGQDADEAGEDTF